MASQAYINLCSLADQIPPIVLEKQNSEFVPFPFNPSIFRYSVSKGAIMQKRLYHADMGLTN